VKADLKKILKALADQGWKITQRRSSHYRLQSPNGDVYFAGSTPSDRRAVLNLRADLRRMGADL
jgi:predicted RNA binding protein YcfA (HicA-like mRNA interferase family)